MQLRVSYGLTEDQVQFESGSVESAGTLDLSGMLNAAFDLDSQGFARVMTSVAALLEKYGEQYYEDFGFSRKQLLAMAFDTALVWECG